MFFPANAGETLFFPEHGKTLSAETMPYSQMLHTGMENDTFYMRGRFGVDFPIIGYDFDSNGGDNNDNGVSDNNESGNHRKILFGINAAAHINMKPTSSMRFPVDNFYAVLALNFSGNISEKWSWRFYPVHHVSAHLADGSDDIKNGAHAVSSEMTRGEVYYKPFGELIELGAGAGWYYHVCSQEDLRYRGDISILLTPQINILNGAVKPYALLLVENVFYINDIDDDDKKHAKVTYRGKNNLGIDLSAGILSLKNKRGFGLSLRYFNRLHSSYYFEQYEKSWGVEYTFIY